MHKSNRAFTLIELLTVGLIIIILVGLVIAGASYAQRRAAILRIKAEINSMIMALEKYKLDVGAYLISDCDANSSIKIKQMLLTYPFRAEQLSGNLIIDPFGTPYRYCTPINTLNQVVSVQNPLSYDLFSCGPNRICGDFDDISN